jgi:secreted trypsin-like serine protease
VRRLILVLATMGVAVLLASGAALAITNGNPDTNTLYKYPYVGALVDEGGEYCTGTLISPTVFLTAAHCYPLEGNTSYVTFDSTYTLTRQQSLDFPVGGGNEYSGEFIDDSNGTDIAVVKFANPPLGNPPKFDVNGTPANTSDDVAIPLPKLPTLGQLAGTAKGAKFTAVGYGDTSGSSNDYGTRRYAVSTFKSVNQTYLSLSQHNGSGGTCYGDSGGPNFRGRYGYAYDNDPATSLPKPTIASTTITGDTWCKATNVTLRLDTASARGFLDDYVTLP